MLPPFQRKYQIITQHNTKEPKQHSTDRAPNTLRATTPPRTHSTQTGPRQGKTSHTHTKQARKQRKTDKRTPARSAARFINWLSKLLNRPAPPHPPPRRSQAHPTHAQPVPPRPSPVQAPCAPEKEPSPETHRMLRQQNTASTPQHCVLPQFSILNFA